MVRHRSLGKPSSSKAGLAEAKATLPKSFCISRAAHYNSVRAVKNTHITDRNSFPLLKPEVKCIASQKMNKNRASLHRHPFMHVFCSQSLTLAHAPSILFIKIKCPELGPDRNSGVSFNVVFEIKMNKGIPKIHWHKFK